MILIMVLLMILMLCTGCSEYIHKPDEITVELHAWETNYGWLGKAPTYGFTLGGTWQLTEKGGE